MTRPIPWVLVAGDFRRNGGMDRANLALAEYLLENHHQVELVCHSVDSTIARHPLIAVNLVRRPLNSFMLGGPALEWTGRKVAKRNPNRIVVVNGANCCWPGVNWAHYVHSAWRPLRSHAPVLDRTKQALMHRWNMHRERRAYRSARIVISNSHLTRNHIIHNCNVEPSRVRTIYLGCEPEWGVVTPLERIEARKHYGIPEHRYVAVFIGALGLDHRKGFDVTFSAWKHLCSRPDWDVDLLVAGDGRARGLWERQIQHDGLQERIHVLGFSRDVKRLLACADVLVSPTRYEPYGLNVQEALCREVPAIVSACAGIAERYPVELEPLLLSNPEDSDGLVRTLQLWRSDPVKWSQRTKPLAALLRAHTWRDAARDIVATAIENYNLDTTQGPLQ